MRDYLYVLLEMLNPELERDVVEAALEPNEF